MREDMEFLSFSIHVFFVLVALYLYMCFILVIDGIEDPKYRIMLLNLIHAT